MFPRDPINFRTDGPEKISLDSEQLPIAALHGRGL